MSGELLPVNYGPIFFCQNPEQFGDGSAVNMLATKRPTWWLQNDLPWMSRPELEAVIQKALDNWEAVANVSASKATTAAAANFLITVAQLDGPGGVLADMELPFPGKKQQRMRIDIAEQAMKEFLEAILTHEFGHAFGLQHFPPGPPPELMEPSLNPSVRLPQPTEAALMVQWYGPPLATAVPPGSGPLAEPTICTIRVESGSNEVKCDLTAQRGARKVTLSGSKPW